MKIERLAPGHLRYTLNGCTAREYRGDAAEVDSFTILLKQAASQQYSPTINVPCAVQESLPLPTLNFGSGLQHTNDPPAGWAQASLPSPHLDYGYTGQPAAPASYGYPNYAGAAGAPAGNAPQESLPLPALNFGAAARPAAPASYPRHASAPVGNLQQETLPLPVLNFGPDNGPAGLARATGGGGTAEAQSTQPSLPTPPSVFT